PRSYVSPLQRFAEHAARRAVYIVMTIAIAIPVWLATRPGTELAVGAAAPLDAPTPAHAAPAARPARERAVQAAGTEGPHPLVASFAGLPPRETPALTLEFEGDSWAQ